MVGFLNVGELGYLSFLVDGFSCRWTFTVIKRALRARDAAEEIHENNGDLDMCSLKKDDYAALVIEGGLFGADGQELKGDVRVGVLKGAVEAFLGQYDDGAPSVLLNLYPEYGQGEQATTQQGSLP